MTRILLRSFYTTFLLSAFLSGECIAKDQGSKKLNFDAGYFLPENEERPEKAMPWNVGFISDDGTVYQYYTDPMPQETTDEVKE